MDRFESRHPATDVDAVRITNLHGDVRVRTTGENLIEVTAIIQHSAELTSPEVRVQFDARPATISVSVAKPRNTEYLQRVDLAVSLPGHIALISQTDSGLLEIKGRSATVEAHSNTGRIYVSSRAPVKLHNIHGPVEVVFNDTPAGTVETRTGDITAWLLHPMAVNVKTQSSITTDFTIDIDIDENGFRNGAARLGRGRSKLHLESTRGAVRLLQQGR